MVCFLISEIAKFDEDNPDEGMGIPDRSSSPEFSLLQKAALGYEPFFNSYDSETLVLNFYVCGHTILRMEYFVTWMQNGETFRNLEELIS